MASGQDRYSGVEKRYNKYLKNQRIANIILLVAFFVFFLAIPVIATYFPITPRGLNSSQVTLISYGITAGLLLAAVRFLNRGVKVLPSVEDRVFYFVSSAISDLKLFASSGSAYDKESALASLKKAADVIDSWTWGNLKFLKDGVGKAITDFRTNFRGRLIPAIGRADKRTIQGFFMQLTGFVNAFELDQFDQHKIEGWNQWLTVKLPPDLSTDIFPYEKPRPGTWKKLVSKRLHLSVIMSVFLVPLATGLIGVYVVQIPPEAAYQDAAIVFSGMVILLAYLIFGRQKSS